MDRRRKRRRDSNWNSLAILALIASALILMYYGLIYQFPYSFLNPFSPEEPKPVETVESITQNTIQLDQTNSDEAMIPLENDLQELSSPMPTITVTSIIEDIEVVVTETPDPEQNFLFVMQGDKPAAVAAELFNPEREDCNWMGVGGQVFDQQGRPVTGIIVQMGGYINGGTINLTSLTGTAMNYGRAGYEFTIADKPIASSGQLWVRLLNQERVPISDLVYFDTFDDQTCQYNLIIINFKQISSESQ